MIDFKVTVFFLFFFKCLNATIPLTCTLANEYTSSNEISKKNSTVRGDCIACDALLSDRSRSLRVFRKGITKFYGTDLVICSHFERG